MPEPFTIITGVSALISNSAKLLKDVQSTVSAIKNAPAHITAISNDLKDFYSVLGTLQIILDDEPYSERFQRTSLTNLQSVLVHGISVFTKLQTIVSGFSNHERVPEQGKWKSFNWTLQETEPNLRAAQLNATELITAVHQYRQDVTETLESLQASQLDGTQTHTEIDRAALEFDTDYGIRRFLNSAPPSPSLQVSTLNGNVDSLDSATISDQVSFHTAFSRPDIAPRDPIIRPHTAETVVVAPPRREIRVDALVKCNFYSMCIYDVYLCTKLVALPGDTAQDIISKAFTIFASQLGNSTNLDSSIGYLSYTGTRLQWTENLDRFLSIERPAFFYYEPRVLQWVSHI